MPGSSQPWLAAWALAIIGFVSYLFVGMPLGISTSYVKLVATFSVLLLRELHFHYRIPLAHTLSVLPGACLVGIATRMVPGF